VQEANVGIDSLNDLAVKLEDEAEDAMGGRMLRPKVDGEITDDGFHCSGLSRRQRDGVKAVP
jgi:hypothetical protein